MKILVITLSNVGDAVLTTAVLEALKYKFPEAVIDILVGKRARDVFISDTRVRKVIIYDKRVLWREKFQLWQNLRKNKYNLVIDLKNTLGAYFISPKVYKSKNIRAHSYLKHLTALRKFYTFAELRRFKPRIIFSRKDNAYVDSLELNEFLIISPFARSYTKSWPRDSFKKVISLLRNNFPRIEIVLIGEASESEFSQELVLDSKVKNLIGKTTVTELASLISRARLVITNDSASLHIASATGTPAVAIFGPTSEVKYGPLVKGSFVLRRYYPCSPCERAQCKFQDKRCLTSIKPEEVFNFTTRILSSTPLNIRSDYKRILLTRTDKIGDLILTTPVIEVMRKKFPGAFIAFLCNVNVCDLLKNNPYLDEILVLDKRGKHRGILGFLKILKVLRSRRFDLVINFHPTNRVHLLSFFARIPKRVGYDWKMGWLNNIVVKHLKQEGKKSEAEYNFDLLKPLGVSEISLRQLLIPEKASLKWVEEEMKKKGIKEFIVIHPGASCKSKLWPLENFINLAKRIISGYNIVVVFILGPEEIFMQEKIQSQLNSQVLIYTGLDLSKLTALIFNSRMMVSNDSGPMHIADAFSKPVIAIFGRNQPGLSSKRWGPLGRSAVVIQKDVGCKYCLAHNCDKDFLCLKEVTVDEVYNELEKLFNSVVK